ncbi:helix-turn-helix transcriptional regulator [Haloferax sp. DFSO52]|uniref:helix-turn-helix transcriptional regulator n=1 Tax=Haloferax sp. DFSO52 TaxID=3388505 RepID=UPI003A88BE6D
MVEPFAPTVDAFDTVAFLAGSPNRIMVLDSVISFGPISRRELVDVLGLSRVTVSRILDDFEERNWVSRRGTLYDATPVGEVVCELFERFLQTAGALHAISEVLPWLPPGFDVDVRLLTTARITIPTWSDSIAPVRRAARLCEGNDVLRVAASGVAPDVINGIRNAAVEDGADVEVTLTTTALSVLCGDPPMRIWFHDLVDAGGRVYEHPGHPYLLATCDRRAVIGMNDDMGVPRGLIESTDADIFEWVAETITRCREEAVPVDNEVFSG